MNFINHLLDIVSPFSPVLAPMIIGLFIVYAAWYATSLKTYAPMKPEEARLLWQIHKKEAECKAKKMHEIKRKNKIIGFRCECGYKYVQKRPAIR